MRVDSPVDPAEMNNPWRLQITPDRPTLIDEHVGSCPVVNHSPRLMRPHYIRDVLRGRQSPGCAVAPRVAFDRRRPCMSGLGGHGQKADWKKTRLMALSPR